MVHAAESSVKRLKEKIKKLTEEHGESVENELNLLGIMRNNDQIKRLTQMEASVDYLGKAATSKRPCHVKWHSVMMK